MKAIGSSLPTLYHGEDISGGEGGGMMVVPVGLPSLLFVDVLAAIVASLLVSPLVAVIDKAIIQYSAGVTSTLLSPICSGMSDMLRNPGKFILKPEFLIVWCVYLLTYVAANVIATVCEHTGADDEIPKLIGISFTNISACVSKDAILAKMFGKAPGAVPLITYALFTCRDVMTVAASFSAPEKISKWMETCLDVATERGDSIAQLLCPVLAQIFSTPIHLLGLSFFNSPNDTPRERASNIKGLYCSALQGRMARILPAFGFGGISNKWARGTLRAAVTPRPPIPAKRAAPKKLFGLVANPFEGDRIDSSDLLGLGDV